MEVTYLCAGVRACRYPGSPVHGVVSPVKFVYSVGEVAVVVCDSGYTALTNNTLVCTESGDWTQQIPVCVDI